MMGDLISRKKIRDKVNKISGCFTKSKVMKIIGKEQVAYYFDDVLERLKRELKLADDEKSRCIKENPMQFDEAKGYARGIAVAIEIVKGGMKNEIN